jgi:hypothetical protein
MREQQQQWTAGPFVNELDGYAIYIGEGLGAIATDPEYQKRIVTAINSFDALREALRSVIDAYDRSKDEPSPPSAISVIRAAVEPARAALALADGQVEREWSGSPDPADPDNFWIDDATGERVNAETGERSQVEEQPDGLVELTSAQAADLREQFAARKTDLFGNDLSRTDSFGTPRTDVK